MIIPTQSVLQNILQEMLKGQFIEWCAKRKSQAKDPHELTNPTLVEFILSFSPNLVT